MGEMKMTWTLFGMSFCYIVFVGPIFFCSIFMITGNVNLGCFILYWFQYTTNFVIYAARSEQYRKAYIQYIKTTLPWCFKISPSATNRKRRKKNTIYIINPVLRRTSSTPELNFHKDKNSLKVDVKVEYSLDLKFENILHSRYEIVEEESPTIIIVSSEEYQIDKKTRFLDSEDDEFSSEDQVETCGIDKEYRSEYFPKYDILHAELRRTLSF